MDSAADAQPRSDHGITGPLLPWLIIQLLALLLATARVPLAARYPQPAELLAAHVMVVVQLTAAALLMPYLLRNWAAAVAVIVTAWPFLVLGGVLSALPTARLTALGGFVTAWLIAFALVNLTAPDAWRLWACAAAAVGTSGGLVLTHLSEEFGGRDTTWLSWLPPLAALRQVNDQFRILDWALPAALSVICAGVLLLRTRSSHVIHKP